MKWKYPENKPNRNGIKQVLFMNMFVCQRLFEGALCMIWGSFLVTCVNNVDFDELLIWKLCVGGEFFKGGIKIKLNLVF